MANPARISFALMALVLILAGALHLGTLVLAILFGYFVLRKFNFGGRKLVALALYLIVVAGIGCGLVIFVRRAYVVLPEVAEKTVPAVIRLAHEQGIELPFQDYGSLKAIVLREIPGALDDMGHYAQLAVREVALLVIGLVVAASVFLNAGFHVGGDPHALRRTPYTMIVRHLTVRFRTFYRSFAAVIGAQIIISTINTSLTAIFIIWTNYPHPNVTIGATFLCGLLPIVGNLLSNTLIIGVGLAVSPRLALLALAFLVTIHKLEYFLNSKIIGRRIKNPMWLTLIGLVLGERLMGIPGMIIAPVVLHYIKVETSKEARDELLARLAGMITKPAPKKIGRPDLKPDGRAT